MKRLLLVVLVLSCTDDAQPEEEVEAGWLAGCESDEACGAGLICVCEVCMPVCQDHAACDDFDGACASADWADRACAEPIAVCAGRCVDDADCSAPLSRCFEGFCAPPQRPDAAIPPRPDRGPPPILRDAQLAPDVAPIIDAQVVDVPVDDASPPPPDAAVEVDAEVAPPDAAPPPDAALVDAEVPPPDAAESPVAVLGGPYEGKEGQPIAFDGSGSIGVIERYAWDFGEGLPVAGEAPRAQHTYLEDGVYPISLTVTEEGRSDEASGEVVVRDCAPRPEAPLVSRGVVGQALEFELACHFDGPDAPVGGTVRWDEAAQEPLQESLFHAWGEAGAFSPRLVCEDSDGTEEADFRVEIYPTARCLDWLELDPLVDVIERMELADWDNEDLVVLLEDVRDELVTAGHAAEGARVDDLLTPLALSVQICVGGGVCASDLDSTEVIVALDEAHAAVQALEPAPGSVEWGRCLTRAMAFRLEVFALRIEFLCGAQSIFASRADDAHATREAWTVDPEARTAARCEVERLYEDCARAAIPEHPERMLSAICQ